MIHGLPVAGRLAIVTALLVAGCTSSSPEAPTTEPGQGGALFDGRLDPGGSSVVLSRLTTPVPGQEPVELELVGSKLVALPDEEQVRVEVALRNVDRRTVSPPVLVFLHDFRPPEVAVLNADASDTTASSVADRLAYVFDYSEFLGTDGLLTPGEVSERRVWVFHDPALGAFSFRATARVGLGEGAAYVSGVAFWDQNRDGEWDAEEPPVFGTVVLRGGDGLMVTARIDPSGHYRVPVRTPGLYRLQLNVGMNPPPCYRPLPPLEVVLPPGPDGLPVGFDGADFAVPGCGDAIPASVVVTDGPPDQIEQDRYDLVRAELEGSRMFFRVAFAGCSPRHPFRLYASRNFTETEPPRTWMLLQHDDLGEFCEAYWHRDLEFDLAPLGDAVIDAFGGPRPIIIMFRDFEGNTVREFEFNP